MLQNIDISSDSTASLGGAIRKAGSRGSVFNAPSTENQNYNGIVWQKTIPITFGYPLAHYIFLLVIQQTTRTEQALPTQLEAILANFPVHPSDIPERCLQESPMEQRKHNICYMPQHQPGYECNKIVKVLHNCLLHNANVNHFRAVSNHLITNTFPIEQKLSVFTLPGQLT